MFLGAGYNWVSDGGVTFDLGIGVATVGDVTTGGLLFNVGYAL